MRKYSLGLIAQAFLNIKFKKKADVFVSQLMF